MLVLLLIILILLLLVIIFIIISSNNTNTIIIISSNDKVFKKDNQFKCYKIHENLSHQVNTELISTPLPAKFLEGRHTNRRFLPTDRNALHWKRLKFHDILQIEYQFPSENISEHAFYMSFDIIPKHLQRTYPL